jgi:hypothetical protein
VDLDGTLVQTDTLYECLLLLLAKNPFYLFLLPLWLWRGKAYLKQEICRRVDLDVERLPYHPELVARLQEEPTRNAFRARLWERVRERTEDQAGDKAAVAQIEGQTMAGTPAEFSRKFEIAVANSSPSGGLGQRQFLILDN